MSQSATPRTPSNRWTPERQLRFLDTLSRTRSVSAAAASAGMSRESAYRLRARSKVALFALPWDRALEINHAQQVHTDPLGDGQLARRLGNHYRRESGDFAAIRAQRSEVTQG